MSILTREIRTNIGGTMAPRLFPNHLQLVNWQCTPTKLYFPAVALSLQPTMNQKLLCALPSPDMVGR
jgi:hypothetical protein